MKATDRKTFFAALSRTFETYGKPMPNAEVLDVWWTKLEPFAIEAVAAAFSRHIDASEFPPVPAAILKLLPKQRDGHVEADEAWTIAIRALDERNTVVWTPQIAEAWGRVSHVADGDETAARMAFRSAYASILDAARTTGEPAKWSPTLGFDVEQREQIVGEAVRAGRLSLTAARAAVPMLAGPDSEPVSDGAAQQIAKLHGLVEGIGSARDRAIEARSAHVREEADRVIEQKRSIATRVDGYQQGHA